MSTKKAHQLYSYMRQLCVKGYLVLTHLCIWLALGVTFIDMKAQTNTTQTTGIFKHFYFSKYTLYYLSTLNIMYFLLKHYNQEHLLLRYLHLT